VRVVGEGLRELSIEDLASVSWLTITIQRR